ncbi:hypothetical protein WA026_012622 [Henosepilachna vigintioctopunctata]|uniref:Uncharacterized protein n=1 Tax=Henosepilachna vigintioctopunctata TaxID=420089 RepID=A0AAW1U1B4_9CUCU
MNDIINLNKKPSGSVDKGEFHQITNEAVTTLNSEAGAKSVKRLHENKPSTLAMNNKSDKNRNLNARHPRGIVATGTGTKPSIKGIEQLGLLHVCELDPSLTEDCLINYVDDKGFKDTQCVKLQSR